MKDLLGRPRALLLMGVLAVLCGSAAMVLVRWSRTAPAAPAAEAAPPAAPGPEPATMYVTVPETFARAAPEHTAPALARLRIGLAVEVLPTPGEWRQLARGAGQGGFVPDDALAATPPTAEDALRRAREALADAQPDAAVAEARRAVALDGSLREAWDLLAAIYDARGDVNHAAEVYRRRAALPAPAAPSDEEPGWPAPTAGERRYVAATKLRVRRTPSRGAAIEAELPLNTEVQVLARSGEFAQVRWQVYARASWILDLSESDVPRFVTVGGEPREGFAAAAYLAPEPLTVDALLAQAAALEAEAKSLEAARALERASLLASDPEVLRRLVRVAARARLYPVAAGAAMRLQQRGAGEGTPAADATVEVLFGCREAPPVEAGSACLSAVDTLGACEPCDAPDRSLFMDDDMEPEERTRILNAHAEAELEVARRREAHEAAQAELERRTEQLREQHPSGPWCHAVVKGDDRLEAQGQRVFVYTLPFSIGGYCGNVESTVDSATLAGEDVLWPKSGETLELWVRLPGYENVLCGVVPARDADEAQRRIQAHAPEVNASEPTRFGPAPNAAGPFKACVDCCGC